MKRAITFKGTSLTLVGRHLSEGSRVPDFRVSSVDLKEVTLRDFQGKIKLISSFPSLDTPVCDMQVKEFNKRALQLSGDIVVLGISKDLPFAQKRFCEMNNIKNEIILSDYKLSSFGINYGLLIKELNLLARAVLILDKNNTLRYFRIVEELSSAPDSAEALKQLAEVVKSPEPAAPLKEELPEKCKPCEGGIAPLPKEKVEKLMVRRRGWEIEEDKKLIKKFKFKDFVEAKFFTDLVSIIAEEQGHHPTLTLSFNRLRIALTTHAAGGLTENDFIMVKIIDKLEGEGGDEPRPS